jgi:hypothetical protein
MTCNNEVLKTLGTLRGVFGAEMDRIDGRIVVNHTDEVSREEIAATLDSLGWKEIQKDEGELNYDEPSIRGGAL